MPKTRMESKTWKIAVIEIFAGAGIAVVAGLIALLEEGTIDVPIWAVGIVIAALGSLMAWLRTLTGEPIEGTEKAEEQANAYKRTPPLPAVLLAVALSGIMLAGCADTPSRLTRDMETMHKTAEDTACIAGLGLIAAGETGLLIQLQHHLEDVVSAMYIEAIGTEPAVAAETLQELKTIRATFGGEALATRLLLRKGIHSPRDAIDQGWVLQIEYLLRRVDAANLAPSAFGRTYGILRGTSKGLRKAWEVIYVSD